MDKICTTGPVVDMSPESHGPGIPEKLEEFIKTSNPALSELRENDPDSL
jgi:hypothetical protein